MVLGCFFAGIINSALGAAGGMIIVPVLKKYGLEQKQAHATCLCIVLPMTAVSSCLYIFGGHVSFEFAIPYIVYGILGAFLGTFVFRKINSAVLQKILAMFILIGGLKLLFK
jgi:uncharacterized membrane protein YfcA